MAAKPKEPPGGKLLSQAIGCFDKGDQDSESVIGMLRNAIQAGLPTEADEVTARIYLAVACGRRSVKVTGPEVDQLRSESVSQLEEAARLDSRGGHGVLAQRLATLPAYDTICSFAADAIAEKDGHDAAIAFLEQKVALFAHVPGDRLIHILEQLGERYFNRYEDRRSWREAERYLQRVLRSDPIPGWESDYEETKEFARKNLTVTRQFVIERVDRQQVQVAPSGQPVLQSSVQSGGSAAGAGGKVVALKARLLAIALKHGLLWLYCPIRSKRETASSESWFLLGLLPPAAAFLLALLLMLFARGGGALMGMGMTVLLAAIVYVVLYLYISYLGPPSQEVMQILGLLPAQRAALRTELDAAETTLNTERAAARETQDELYAQKLEQEAKATRQNSRVLEGAFRMMWGAVMSLKDGDKSPEECFRYYTVTFKLGWMGVKAIDNIKNQEQYDNKIGGYGGQYTSEQFAYCEGLIGVWDNISLKGADTTFLSNNPAAREMVQRMSDMFLQDGRFDRDALESTLMVAFIMGYIAAKSPNTLGRYLTILTTRLPT